MDCRTINSTQISHGISGLIDMICTIYLEQNIRLAKVDEDFVVGYSSLFPLFLCSMLGTLLPTRSSIGQGYSSGAFSKELELLGQLRIVHIGPTPSVLQLGTF